MVMSQRLKKLLFGLQVVIYLFGVFGMPVYFHYCGGELEEISYFVKGGGCCDGKEGEPDGCCSDESVVLVNSFDGISKVKTELPDLDVIAVSGGITKVEFYAEFDSGVRRDACNKPPDLLRQALVATSVMRI
jgi:hypothetical protein